MMREMHCDMLFYGRVATTADKPSISFGVANLVC